MASQTTCVSSSESPFAVALEESGTVLPREPLGIASERAVGDADARNRLHAGRLGHRVLLRFRFTRRVVETRRTLLPDRSPGNREFSPCHRAVLHRNSVAAAR